MARNLWRVNKGARLRERRCRIRTTKHFCSICAVVSGHNPLVPSAGPPRMGARKGRKGDETSERDDPVHDRGPPPRDWDGPGHGLVSSTCPDWFALDGATIASFHGQERRAAFEYMLGHM